MDQQPSVAPAPQVSAQFPSGRRLLAESWKIFSAHVAKFVKFYLIAVAASLPAAAVFLLYAVIQLSGVLGEAEQQVVNVVLSIIGVVAVAVMVVVIIVSSYGSIFMLKRIDAMDASWKSVWSVYRESFKYFWRFVGIAIGVGLIQLVGFLLFIVPGIVFMVWYSLSNYAAAIEDRKIGDAMNRSKELVKNFGWVVFWRFLVLWATGLAVIWGSSIILGLISEGIFLTVRGEAAMIAETVIGVIDSILSIVFQFIYGVIAVIYSYQIFQLLVATKALNPQASAGTTTMKKVGISLLVIVFALVLVGFMIAMVAAAAFSEGFAP